VRGIRCVEPRHHRLASVLAVQHSANPRIVEGQRTIYFANLQ
jgi:hypothetical protein